MSDAKGRIAQADPGAAYSDARTEIDAAIERVLSSGVYILGAETRAFEAEFAAFLTARCAIGCASGTDALVLALRALGIGPGDAVATVSHTAVATVAAIEIVGATPVLLDIEEEAYTLDTAELEELLSSGGEHSPIKAVIPVHLYGQPADLHAVRAVASSHEVAIVEDCAQAHGACYDGVPVGAWGAAGAFSFYPTKNLGGLGDGGAVVTDDGELADRLRSMRQYGWSADRISQAPGVNSRLDELQAAILRVKLARLDRDNGRRQAIAKAYDASLLGTRLKPPARRAGSTHVFHQYVVRDKSRDDLQRQLLARGVATAVHYPAPVHRQPAYEGRVVLGPRRCRMTDLISPEILSLPMHQSMSDADVEIVCEALERL